MGNIRFWDILFWDMVFYLQDIEACIAFNRQTGSPRGQLSGLPVCSEGPEDDPKARPRRGESLPIPGARQSKHGDKRRYRYAPARSFIPSNGNRLPVSDHAMPG